MICEIVQPVLETSKGISEFGMLVIAAAFFLVLSAAMWIVFLKWFMKIINGTMEDQRKTFDELLEETKNQNIKLATLSENFLPETNIRIKTISNMAFDLAVEKVCNIVKKVMNENHISNKEATHNKITQLITNLHDDRNSKFDLFTYKGRKLSTYTSKKWVDKLVKVVEGEVYNEKGYNESRVRTNVEAAYAGIRLDLYHNMNDE